VPQRPHSASRPDLPPLVVRAQPGPESRPFVVGGAVRHSQPTPEANVPPRQDLPPSERQENAPVKLLPPSSAKAPMVEAAGLEHAAITPFGPAVPIDAPSLRAGQPAYLKNYDIVSLFGQKAFYAYVADQKAHVYVVPERWVRRTASGDLIPFTGVDSEGLPKGQQFTTSDPNFRPWQAKAADKAEDIGIGAVFIALCILAAVALKKRGWI
jgi:hypothetical protein